MSTRSLDAGFGLQPGSREGTQGAGFRWLLAALGALKEGKAAADAYQTLVARGTHPGRAAQRVFQTHFGRR